MDDYLPILIIFGIIVAISIISWLLENWHLANKYRELKPQLDNLDTYKEELESKAQILVEKERAWQKKVETDKKALQQISKEKSIGFPWLANAYADFFYLEDIKRSDYLKFKPHPARKASEHVKEISADRKKAEKLYRILKYQLEYYENLFPWLIEFKIEDIDDLIKQVMSKSKDNEIIKPDTDDPARKWLTASEYQKLPEVEKYQLALDRYWSKKKTKWEIGRDYERYIGYLYEHKGYQVYYQGIIKGLADLGRDLVATNGNETQIIQCKYWSSHKTIHEKHIFQLFGTTIEYWLKNKDKYESFQYDMFSEFFKKNKIKAKFITSTKLSDKAREFANALGVKVVEDFPLKKYPSIKCNVSRRNGEQIFHLPFDQQYDRTIIEKERNECYVYTVKEAMRLGFRRAYRWRGSNVES